jgi:hypothetical protein
VRALAILLAATALLEPGAARASACSPLSCSASQFVVGGGRMLAMRGEVESLIRVVDLRTGTTRWHLPPGIVVGDTLVSQSPPRASSPPTSNGTLLTWYSLATGARLRDAVLQLRGVFQLVGASQDGRRAVLARTQTRSTTFALVSSRSSRIVKLGGRSWSFDALRGSKLFLIRSDAYGYQVRLYDLATNTLVRQALKNPGESATISGIPFERASSPDNRYLFTLYIGEDGNAMVHELDLVGGSARCIDLPGRGDFGAATTWALVPAADGRTLWAVSAGYGRVVAIDVASHRVRSSYSFQAGRWNSVAGVAVLSPDARRIAYTDAQHVWLVDLAARKVVQRASRIVLALGWSPDGRRLWTVGASGVSQLPPG